MQEISLEYLIIMDILGKLFGSPARIKVMRLLLASPAGINALEFTKITKLSPKNFKKELTLLQNIGFAKTNKKNIVLNLDFPYLTPLRDLLVAFPQKNDLCKKICKFGKIKLLVIAGNLLGMPEKRVDLLVVGDKLQKKSLEKTIAGFEAELGRSIDFAILDTPEFLYRFSMYDKFIRDILEFGHEKLVCTPELSTKLVSA
ncbi:hypothetical protein A2645_00805 [Candidatus Nomurabacteria bacterium RIFCSPHIGHO2_01_FULL_39_9]|uniref:HTH arsR-type domain-containing protein n=1 Tax=Candidatus Nomurabacteria bacterium RIFCSPHIGHO2_01_FULL_39_9 TaxID=1801735 RepID=A0A1F6UW25_9BACT|nr:MAG: hypothetical protein A2645_00805 [Candidatus Nomurabacteria bacterium RIFCSPHIGHO2_01_FULL_39_9]